MHGDGIVFIWRTESCERHYKFRDTHITSPRVFSNVLLDFGQEQRSPVSVLISKPSSIARLRELITRIRHNFCQHFWVGFLATVTLRVTNRHRFGHFLNPKYPIPLSTSIPVISLPSLFFRY